MDYIGNIIKTLEDDFLIADLRRQPGKHTYYPEITSNDGLRKEQ